MHPTPWLRMWMLVLVLFVLVGMWVWVWVFPPSWGVGAVGSPRFSLPSSLCLGSTGGAWGPALVPPFPFPPPPGAPRPPPRAPPFPPPPPPAGGASLGAGGGDP